MTTHVHLAQIVIILNWSILIYLLVLAFLQVVLAVIALIDDITTYNEIFTGDVLELMHTASVPPVTVMIAAYNEEKDILRTVNSVLNNDYSNKFILIINDGSTDNTVQTLIDALEMVPISIPEHEHLPTIGKVKNYYVSHKHHNISLVDKEHYDKSDSLNVGLNYCHTPHFITVDADTLLDPDAISEIMFTALSTKRAVAVGGAVYISNGCEVTEDGAITSRMPYKFIPAYQACEYLRSFLFNRTAWNAMGGGICYSGAFTLFEHRAVVEVGGFHVDNFANDFEIVTSLQHNRLDKKIAEQITCTSAAACWTDVPETLGSFLRQRYKWQIGSLKSIFKHVDMLFNFKYKSIGMIDVPFFLFFELLSPFVEIAAYICFGLSLYLQILDIRAAALIFVVCYSFMVIYTLSALLFNFMTFRKYVALKDIPWVIFVTTFEFLGFRQIHAIWRVCATIEFCVVGIKNRIKMIFMPSSAK